MERKEGVKKRIEKEREQIDECTKRKEGRKRVGKELNKE